MIPFFRYGVIVTFVLVAGKMLKYINGCPNPVIPVLLSIKAPSIYI